MVPMRWPGSWNQPKHLDLVRGTPVDCLLGKPPGPVAAAAAGLGLTVLDWEARGSKAYAVEGVWPGIRRSQGGSSDSTETGPTGAAWVDSNGWIAQLARARAGGKPVWLDYAPPKEDRLQRDEAYLAAVADAAAAGARWIVALDAGLETDLAKGSPEALARWRKITGSLAFFERHRPPENYRPQGAFGVLSDFSGDNEFLATEVLNLAARRLLLYRILLKAEAAGQTFEGLKAVLYVDKEPPAGALLEKLGSYMDQGGLLIVPAATGKLFAGKPGAASLVPGYSIRRLGRGRLATPDQPWEDPYLLAQEAHLLMSHRHDPLRLFNPGSRSVHYTAAPDGSKARVDLVSYSGRAPANDVTLMLAAPCRTARLLALGSAKAVPLKLVRARAGLEIPLPPISVYAAIELEK